MINYLWYGNVSSVDERHCHRYEVSYTKLLFDGTDHSMMHSPFLYNVDDFLFFSGEP